MSKRNWRINYAASQAVFAKIQSDILASELRIRTLLGVSDFQDELLGREDFVETVEDELSVLGGLQQRLYALKVVQPQQTLPNAQRTPFDESATEHASSMLPHARSSLTSAPLSSEELKRQLVANHRKAREDLYTNKENLKDAPPRAKDKKE